MLSVVLCLKREFKFKNLWSEKKMIDSKFQYIYLTKSVEQCWIQNHSNTRANPHLQYIPGRSHYKRFCKKCCDWPTQSWSGSDMFSRLPTYWPCRWSFWPWISFCRPLWIARHLGRLWRVVCNPCRSAASERGRQWWPRSKSRWRPQKGWTKKQKNLDVKNYTV